MATNLEALQLDVLVKVFLGEFVAPVLEGLPDYWRDRRVVEGFAGSRAPANELGGGKEGSRKERKKDESQGRKEGSQERKTKDRSQGG